MANILPQPRPIEGLYYDEDLTNFGVSGADLTGRDVTSDDIFQDVYTQAFDASRPYGKKMDARMRGLESTMPRKSMQLDLGDTLGGGIHRIPLDTPQGYQSNIRHGTGTSLVRDAVAKYLDPDSTSMTPWGEDKKMRDPNLFARIAGNVIAQGAGLANEGFGMNFFQNPKQTYEDLLANWSAKETDYFTSPEQKAKTLANYFSTSEGYIPRKLGEMASENWKSFDRDELAKNIIQPDGSVMTMGPNFNYGETQAAPNIPMDRFGNTVGPVPPVIDDTGVAEVREPTQINNPYQTYMHPYDDVDRWTADEDMTYQPDVKSNRFSGLTNPVKKGAGVLMSGLMKIPGAGIFLDAVQPASPELRAQAGAVSAADTSGLMAGQNMISMFGTNDPEEMILDRINRIKTRKAAQSDISRNRIIELQRLADEANRAKHTATADLGGGWMRQNRPGGAATFTGPGGQTHQGWSNTAAGTRAAAASEGSFARGGIIGAF